MHAFLLLHVVHVRLIRESPVIAMYPACGIWSPVKKKESTLLFGKSGSPRPQQCGSIFHRGGDCQRQPAVTCFTLLQLPCQKLVNLLHLHQRLSEATSSCMKKDKTVDSNAVLHVKR